MRPRNPPAVAAADPPFGKSGRSRSRGIFFSDDVMSRCKSAPERIVFAEGPYSLSASEAPLHHRQAKCPATTSSKTSSRATGQGTIDQYFIKKKDEMKASQVRGTNIRSSMSTNKNVSQRSHRPRSDPPTGTACTTRPSSSISSTGEVLSAAEQRDDSHNDVFGDDRTNQRIGDLASSSPSPSSPSESASATLSSSPTAESDLSVHIFPISPSQFHEDSTIKISQGSSPPSPSLLPSSPVTLGSNLRGPTLNEADSVQDESTNKDVEGGSTVLSNPAKASADGTATMPVRLLKKGVYSTRLMSSIESQRNSSGRSSSRRATERSGRRSRSGKCKNKTPTTEEKNASPLDTCKEKKESSENFVSEARTRPPEDHSSRMGLLARTVQIPPGKVGAVLYTSPLGPAIQSIKATSSIYDNVAVGDLVVEVDGVDTTKRRAKEVTRMLINSAERERQIVVLTDKAFDKLERKDESIIGKDSIDRYLAFDERDAAAAAAADDDDDELHVASVTVASGQTARTARAGNTRAHNMARNLAENDCTAAKVGPTYSQTAKNSDCDCADRIETDDRLCEAADEPVWEAPERSMDADGLSSRSVKSAGTKSSMIPRIPDIDAASANSKKGNASGVSCRETSNTSDSQKSKGSTTFSSRISAPSQPLPALGIILATGSEISSLSESLESSQFGSDRIIRPNARRLSPIHEESAIYRGLSSEALIAELEQRLALYKAASMESHRDTVQMLRDNQTNSNSSQHSQPGFDLFLDGGDEGVSTSLSTLTPSLADGGGDGRTEKSSRKAEKSFLLDGPEFFPPSSGTTSSCTYVVGENESKSSRWAEIAVLAGSSVISFGGDKRIARRATGTVLSLWKESSNNDRCAHIDYQSIASVVSLEILDAGGSQSCAADTVSAIIGMDTKNEGTSSLLGSREGPMAKDQSKTLATIPLMRSSSPPLLDVSTKPFAAQNSDRFLQGAAAVVSSLSAAQDQIVQDTVQVASSIQQATESLPRMFSANITPSEENQEKSITHLLAKRSSIPVNKQDHGFNRKYDDSDKGGEPLISTYQVGGRTLIVAETDNEVELFFPCNVLGQLNLPVADEQDVRAKADADNDARRRHPTRLFSGAPTNNVSEDTCINDVAEKGPNRSILDRWRSARRKQKARTKAQAAKLGV